jgi:queuosine precursor transporter
MTFAGLGNPASGALSFVAFALCVPAANWMIGSVGQCIPHGPCVIPVGFGLYAPSGVLMIGLALVLRDAVHELLGRSAALAAIAAGCALSLLVAPPALALASTAAFGFSELANHAVYSRLRARGRWLAVSVSGVAGAFLDSLLFVWIAFGSVDLALGTTLAKVYASAAVAAYLRWKRL